MTRVKKVLCGPVDRNAAEEAFANYSLANAKHLHLKSIMENEIALIEGRYKAEIDDLKRIEKESFELLQTYAETNRDAFKGKKSMAFLHGILGFRTGTPKVKPKKGYTWGSVTNLMKVFLPAYIRTSEEPDKDRLRADRDVPEVRELFDKVGILIDQDESFFVEPKKEYSGLQPERVHILKS